MQMLCAFKNYFLNRYVSYVYTIFQCYTRARNVHFSLQCAKTPLHIALHVNHCISHVYTILCDNFDITRCNVRTCARVTTRDENNISL